MKKVTINSCTVNSSNVYDNTSGIDFYKVYSEYNFSPLTNQDTAINFEILQDKIINIVNSYLPWKNKKDSRNNS